MSPFAPPNVAENATIGGAIGDNQTVIDRAMLIRTMPSLSIMRSMRDGLRANDSARVLPTTANRYFDRSRRTQSLDAGAVNE